MKTASLRTHFQMIKDFSFNNKMIFTIWFAVILILLLIMDINFSKRIEGYASIETIDVNFNQNVTIKKIYKSVGDTVEAGSLLLTLENKELNVEISRKRSEINILKSKIKEAKEIKAQNLVQILKQDLLILNKEFQILIKKSNDLSVYAEFDSIISNVYFSKGEYVPAFTDILTLQKKETNLVNAFIPEYEQNFFKPGQIVQVESLDKKRVVSGQVIQTSNEISQAPERLNDFNLTNQWGTKVVIKLKKPVFKRGEKLFIQAAGDEKSFSLFNNVQASLKEEISETTLLKTKYELSSLKKLDDSKYLISDDEGNKISNGVFIYDYNKNKINSFELTDDTKITDIESISINGDEIYLIGSHDSSDIDRNKIIKLHYLGNNKVEIENVFIIKDIIVNKLISEDYINKKEAKNIEIEASDIIGNEIYLGIKGAINKKIHILKINLTNLENLKNKDITIMTFNTPVKHYHLTSLKIVDYNDIYIVLNKDDKSHIYQTDSSFTDFTPIMNILEKVEGLEVINSSFFLATDDNKKNGKLIIKHAN
jgi:hypothetical protein